MIVRRDLNLAAITTARREFCAPIECPESDRNIR